MTVTSDSRRALTSMRPRVFPAEDYPPVEEPAGLRTRYFNEAAGIPRGRQTRTAHRIRRWPHFNEAAGIPRGRHHGVRVVTPEGGRLQ